MERSKITKIIFLFFYIKLLNNESLYFMIFAENLGIKNFQILSIPST
jgi:hypothetical protein